MGKRCHLCTTYHDERAWSKLTLILARRDAATGRDIQSERCTCGASLERSWCIRCAAEIYDGEHRCVLAMVSVIVMRPTPRVFETTGEYV